MVVGWRSGGNNKEAIHESLTWSSNPRNFMPSLAAKRGESIDGITGSIGCGQLKASAVVVEDEAASTHCSCVAYCWFPFLALLVDRWQCYLRLTFVGASVAICIAAPWLSTSAGFGLMTLGIHFQIVLHGGGGSWSNLMALTLHMALDPFGSWWTWDLGTHMKLMNFDGTIRE